MSTNSLVMELKQAGQDEEWYPTTRSMVEAVMRRLPTDAKSILDIGAGDGRVLAWFAEKCTDAKLYGIELSPILIKAQPSNVIPMGTNIFEQNLAYLPVDYIFCNPRYSQYEEWVCKIISEGYAKRAFLIIPQRWKESQVIAHTLKLRGAMATVIQSGDFLDAERRARAVIDIVEIHFPKDRWGNKVADPFDIWFNQNINTFDKAEPLKESETSSDLARKYGHTSIDDMVADYEEESRLLIGNYQAIFKLDLILLQELGVNKEHVREGLKKKIGDLKIKYWRILFERLDAITSRLSTKSKEQLLKKLTDNTSVEFTTSNAYAVVLWTIKNANQYFNEQLIALFRELSTFDGVMGYKSNEKTWGKDHWRYMSYSEQDAFRPSAHRGEAKVSRYALDYRIVVSRYNAIDPRGSDRYEYPGGLNKFCHDLIADVVAVMSNLGFPTRSASSYQRTWEGGKWQDFETDLGVLFQVKAYMNGNLHFRFMPTAIMAFNIEAGRLLRWVRTEDEVVSEMGVTREDAKKYFKSNAQLLPSGVKLLGEGAE